MTEEKPDTSLTVKEKAAAATVGVVKYLFGANPLTGAVQAAFQEIEDQKSARALDEFKDLVRAKLEGSPEIDEEWLGTVAGTNFVRKTLTMGADLELVEKREFIANAFINGVRRTEIDEVIKFKFADILRHVSRAALLVLLQLYRKYHVGLGGSTSMHVDSANLAPALADELDPFLFQAGFEELRSHGVFSSVLHWGRDVHGRLLARGGLTGGAMAYTAFTDAFAEFVLNPDELVAPKR